MDKGTRVGVFFGTTSGVITTTGLLVGLNAGTESLVAVLGGIFVIAIADSMSDALGIHLAEESDPDNDAGHIWSATLVTFLAKFSVALSYAIPLLFLPLELGVLVSVMWGIVVLVTLSFFLAKAQEVSPLPVIAEHLLIAAGVIVLSYFVGIWVNRTFA